MWHSLHPNIRTRIKTQFLSRFGSSLIFPFMAIYLTHAYDAQIAGILMLCNISVAFLAGIYGGYLTDILGRRLLLRIGETIKLLVAIGIFCANLPVYHFPGLTFLMLTIGNIASGLINPASEAMLVDVSTEQTRTYMYAINYWAGNLSLMLGTLIGSWLFQDYFIVLTAGLVIINGISWFLTKQFITETHPQNKISHRKFSLSAVSQNYQIVLKDYAFVFYTIGGILLLSIEFQRTNFIAVHLAENFVPFQLGAISIDGTKMIGLLTTTNTLIIVLCTAPFSLWLNRHNQRHLFIVGVIIFASGFAIQASTTHFYWLLLSSIILSCGELLCIPIRQTQLATLMPAQQRGAYIAFNGATFQISKILASLMLVGAPFLSPLIISFLILLLGCGAIFFTLLGLRTVHAAYQGSKQNQR